MPGVNQHDHPHFQTDTHTVELHHSRRSTCRQTRRSFPSGGGNEFTVLPRSVTHVHWATFLREWLGLHPLW